MGISGIKNISDRTKDPFVYLWKTHKSVILKLHVNTTLIPHQRSFFCNRRTLLQKATTDQMQRTTGCMYTTPNDTSTTQPLHVRFRECCGSVGQKDCKIQTTRTPALRQPLLLKKSSSLSDLQVKGSPGDISLKQLIQNYKGSFPVTCGITLDPRETMYPSTTSIFLINRRWWKSKISNHCSLLQLWTLSLLFWVQKCSSSF